jgi:signal transduction histidine kinase
VKTEEGLRSRRNKARRPHRPSGAPAVAGQALDHLGAVIGLDAGWVIRSATPGLERLVGERVERLVGRSLRTLLAPGSAQATIDALAEGVQAESRAVVPGMLTGRRPVLLIPAPTAEPSAEIYVVVTDALGPGIHVGADTAEVFRARLVEVEEQLVEAALIGEIADDFSASLDAAVVLPRVADHTARLCRAHLVAVELLDSETGLLSVAAVSGVVRGTVAAPPVVPESTLAGRALAAGAAIELTGEEAERQAARYAPDGEARFRAALAVPLGTGASPLGVLVLCRTGARPFSPTDVHRARQVARAGARTLRNAHLYGELRRQLAELRLQQAEVVEAEKAAALGKLGAGAAHEINNPLAAIVGNAELLLRREPLTPSSQERVERILQAAYRAARVIRQLLTFVRAQPPEIAPTDVVRALREAVAERTADLEAESVRLVDELGVLPSIPADARQLAQVFGHILDNALDAVKATPGTADRTIRLASREHPGRVCLRIENSGLPIHESALPRIFDPFFTTKAVGRGSGLGLAVCHGIVAAHGGRIVAENLPGAVAFLVDLPVAPEPEGPLPAA